MIGTNINSHPTAKNPPQATLPDLSPRMRQTLQHLLVGDSEKQIAHQLGLSRHTVHVYVKALYRGFGVSSRGELLARFVQPPKFDVAKPAMRSVTVGNDKVTR
jgi:DNA-binding NarL/FixJ family response regulator